MTTGEPLPAAPLEAWLRRLGTTPGQLAFGGLVVLLVTGIPLALPYDPAAPLASVEALQERVPFGWLLRGAHLVGAHLFLVALLAHTLDHLVAGSFRPLKAAVWWRAMLTLGLCVGGMFTGFLLRGDAEARAAGGIAAEVAQGLPWIGGYVSRGLFGEPGGSLQVVYLHHLVTFGLLPWILASEHARRLWPGWLVAAACLGLATLGGLLHHPGPGPAPGLATGTMLGPWYLVGVQETLRWLPPALGAIALPTGWMLLLGALGHLGPETPGAGQPRRSARWLAALALWGTVLYLAATLGAFALRSLGGA